MNDTKKTGSQRREAQQSVQSGESSMQHDLQNQQIELDKQSEALHLSQRDIEKSRERYVNSYELAPVGFLTLNRQGVIIAANLTCSHLLQEEKPDLLNRRFDAWIARKHIEKWHSRLSDIWQGQQVSNCEVLLRRRDGSTVSALLSFMGVPPDASPVVHIAITDITGRIEVETELRKSKKIIQDVIDGSSSLIYALDKDGKYTLANKKLLSLLKVGKDQLIGQGRENVYPESVARAHRRNDLAVMNGRAPAEFEELNMEDDGQHVYLSQKFPLFDEDGRLAGVSGISTDITDYKRMAKENLDANIRHKAVLTDAIAAIAATLEQRDPYTAGHQRRVAELAVAIGDEMGLSGEITDGLYFGGLIHDIGKISVPTEILGKPGRLNDIEYGLIKTHSETGFEIIKDIDFPWPVPQMILQHHERMDGSGYPQGLGGEQILLEARILAVADVVEAMSANRPYRAGLGMQAALDEITRKRGAGLDALVVDACLSLIREKGFAFST